MNSIYEKYQDKVSFDSTKLDQLIQLGVDLNEDVVSQLLQVHFETSESTLAEMKSDFTGKEFLKIKSSVHKLKSSCGTLGLNKLHSLCHGLESYLTEAGSDQQTIKHYLDGISYEYFATQKHLLPFSKNKVGA